jgi:hypothetical protein
MNEPVGFRYAVETLIRARLIELIQLSTENGIDIEMLMRDAIDVCDVEPPGNAVSRQ